MLNDFDIQIATRFVFGHDAEKRVGRELRALGATKALIHYDGGDYLEKSGLLDTVAKSLEEAGLASVRLGGVQPNPRLSLVREGIELCRREGIDAVVAVGGGSTIDSAKAIGLGAATERDVWEEYCRRENVPADGEWFADVQKYEQDVLSRRV